MAKIIKATEENVQSLADLARTTFIESHGSSAAPDEINRYISLKYNSEVLKKELSEPWNIYHLIFHDEVPVGFSKIILDQPHPGIAHKNVTKLERLYLLSKFYGMNHGVELFNFNLHLSRTNKQAGMWLFVWKENHRAIAFYKKVGFNIIGSGNFRITETHSNPNHLMFLEY